MALVIHGVNNLKKNFLLSNYSLTTQIVIINISNALIGFIFLFFFNFFLLSSSDNLKKQEEFAIKEIKQITDYLSKHAVKRILTFDDSCNSASKKANRELARIECDKKNFLDKNYEDKLPQLDPTSSQQYIFSNNIDAKVRIKIISDQGIKLVDTDNLYDDVGEVIISDIGIKNKEINKKNYNFYLIYKQIYFDFFNSMKDFFNKRKLIKKDIEIIKNDQLILNEIKKNKYLQSYIYKNDEGDYKYVFINPILKSDIIYGVTIFDTSISFNDYDSAYQSFLLSNFFLFFLSIIFFISFLFSKSIVNPIKILSNIANLERDKMSDNQNSISYLNRKDEIGQLSDDIKSMSKDLKKRILEIEEFTSDVSHELKNPLAGLKSSSDLLQSRKLDDKNKQLLIENMTEDINRMNILISDISNYSLTQVEIIEEKFEKIELISFFKEFKNAFSSYKYSLDIRINENKIYINMNKDKFNQVLFNLIDNAKTFSPVNSIILIVIKTKNKICSINIIDQGSGINPDYKEKIFERFYTDREMDRNSHSGLGLSISRKIIESFGGNIKLVKKTHSGFDGACFNIELPLKDLKN